MPLNALDYHFRSFAHQVDPLNLPISVVINGCDSTERLDQAFEAVRTAHPEWMG